MKKIVLDLESLKVETFVADEKEAGTRGTVEGFGSPSLRFCQTEFYCTQGYDTCQQASCVDTCGYPYQPAC